MGYQEAWEEVKGDLRGSNYFRIWFVLWIILGVTCLVAMGVFASRASETAEEHGLRTFVEKPDTIAFPPFQLRLPHDAQTNAIQQVSCSHAGMPIVNPPTSLTCPSWAGSSLSKCVPVNPNGAAATSPFKDHSSFFRNPTNNISCVVTVNQQASEDKLLGIDIRDPQGFEGGSNGLYTMFFHPGDVQIYLTKRVISQGGKDVHDWHRAMQYVSSIDPVGSFNVTIIMDEFVVLHYQEGDWFSGWMSAGELGGFIFLMYLVHSACMLIVGICLRNDSNFLNSSSSKYQSTSDSSSFAYGAEPAHTDASAPDASSGYNSNL